MFANTYKGLKVLVTGHTGFKGAWMSHWLTELGAEVTGYSLYIPTEPSLFETLKLSNRVHHKVGDIRDLESVDKLLKSTQFDLMFHLAAQPIVSHSMEDPVTTFSTNLLGTVNVLEALRKNETCPAAVIITSDKCYENVEWEYGYRENDRLGGKDPYSASKACAEIAFNSYFRSYFEKSGKSLATARAGNVIGGGDWAKDRIVPDLVKAWSTQESAYLRRPQSTRPWQHVLEPLSGYLWLGASMLGKKDLLVGESFNFGPGAEVNFPVSVLAEEMAKRWPDARFRVNEQSLDLKEANLLKLCCDKALNRLHWTPTLNFKETVAFTADWYHSFYNDKKAMTELTSMQLAKYTELARERGQKWAE